VFSLGPYMYVLAFSGEHNLPSMVKYISGVIKRSKHLMSILCFSQELGLTGIQEKTMAVLAPVPDKPYLDLLAALPKPGQSLQSRPNSVTGRKKKKPDSAKNSKKG